jgi:hypothetical protein
MMRFLLKTRFFFKIVLLLFLTTGCGVKRGEGIVNGPPGPNFTIHLSEKGKQRLYKTLENKQAYFENISPIPGIKLEINKSGESSIVKEDNSYTPQYGDLIKSPFLMTKVLFAGYVFDNPAQYMILSPMQKLLWPPAKLPENNAIYPLVAEVFEKTGNINAAVRSYWASITLANTMFGSRLDKEYIFEHALFKLSLISEFKGEKKWAAILKLASFLSKTYIESKQAQIENNSFYSEAGMINTELKKTKELDRIRTKLENEQEEKYAESMRGVLFGMAMGAAGAVSAQKSGQMYNQLTDPNMAKIKSEIKKNNEMTSISQSYINDISFLTAKNKASIETRAIDFKSAIDADVNEIESGKSFIVSTVLFYLKSSEDNKIYIDVVDDFCQNKPELNDLFNQFKNKSDSADINLFLQALKKYEVEAVKERFEIVKTNS